MSRPSVAREALEVRLGRSRPAAGPPPPPGERIRVVHFVSSFLIGGTERQAVMTANGLDAARYDVGMAAFDEGPLKAELDVPCETFELKGFHHPATLGRMLRFARGLRRRGVDVVHATGFYPNVFAVPGAKLAGVRGIVASVRDLGDMWEPKHRRAQRLVCRIADRVVANARAVARRLVDEGYDPAKIVVIPNGVRCDPPGPARPRPLHDELGIPPGVPVVGVVARLTPVKGVEYFLEAAALLRPRFPEARYVVVGGPQRGGMDGADAYARGLQRRVRGAGMGDRVLFTGFRRDVPDLLRDFTGSVMPSLSEGLSNVVLESMAAAVPVVATRVGGNPELVEEGVTGWLVPPRDPAALAAAIGRLLDDPGRARELGRHGRERVVREFSMDAMVSRTGDLYRELARGKVDHGEG